MGSPWIGFENFERLFSSYWFPIILKNTLTLSIGIIIAFKDYSMRQGILGSPWIGFENFERLFSSYWFPIILKNTLTLSILTLILGFPIPIILALVLNEVKNSRLRKGFQTISYAPHFISTVVLCGMLTLFLSPSSGVIKE